MQICIFDTETTGKVNFKLPASDPSQPRIVEIAAAIVDVPSFRLITAESMLVQPDGFTIPAEVTAIHGITTELAAENGQTAKNMLNWFYMFSRRAEECWAFNTKFDTSMLEIERARCGIVGYRDIRFYDAMVPLTNVCKIPSPWKKGKYKWPTLTEAYKHFYGTPPPSAHGALVDVLSTIAVLKAWDKWKAVTPAPQQLSETDF